MKGREIEEKGMPPLDIVRWLVVVLLIGAGVGANHFYATEPLSLRLIGWVILVCVAGIIAAFTQKGKETISFGREAQIEMRKVVWPTRQETAQTTMLVVAMVIVMSLILWGMDTGLLWLVGTLTGQRG